MDNRSTDIISFSATYLYGRNQEMNDGHTVM